MTHNAAVARAPHTPAIARESIRRANAADDGGDFLEYAVAMLAGLAADEREVKAALIVAAYRRALASEQPQMPVIELDANALAYAHALAKRLDAIDAAGGRAVGRA